VIVGTLLPATPGALLPGTVDLIDPFNTQLVPMALANGALVVDLHSAFAADVPDWIGPDGLHPTIAGYQEMAQLFFDTIRTSFEILHNEILHNEILHNEILHNMTPASESGPVMPFAQWMSLAPSSQRARLSASR
jgi:hypothetical protein